MQLCLSLFTFDVGCGADPLSASGAGARGAGRRGARRGAEPQFVISPRPAPGKAALPTTRSALCAHNAGGATSQNNGRSHHYLFRLPMTQGSLAKAFVACLYSPLVQATAGCSIGRTFIVCRH